MKQINFGIIGSGRIAQQFLEDIKKVSNVRVIGICARNYEKTVKVGKKYNIKKTYKTSNEMLKDQDIDAVYIATMHPTHYPYSIRALKQGKHVLSEKPAVLKVEELEEIIKVAKKKKLLFMEGITVGFNPLYQNLKSIIRDGEIGEVYHVESTFGNKSRKAHKHNPQQAGGALYDIGIYNLYLLNDLLGVPSSISLSKRDNKWGVEGSIAGLARYKGGVTGSFYATMDSVSGNSGKIIGTDGMIELPETWTLLNKFIVKKLGEDDKIYTNSEKHWLVYEIESFVKTILDGKTENEVMSYEVSRSLHKIIDLIKDRLGLEYKNLIVEIN